MTESPVVVIIGTFAEWLQFKYTLTSLYIAYTGKKIGS